MDNVDFEGYTGILAQNSTFSNDTMLVIVLTLLSFFAWLFRVNIPLFIKMVSKISVREQRQSIFNTTKKNSFLFTTFLTFQTLVLFSIFLFAIVLKYRLMMIDVRFSTTLFYICVIFAIFLLFFLNKSVLYALFGSIFIEKASSKMMLINFQSLFCLWGIALYVPVLWVLLFNTSFLIPIIIFIISYLVFIIILLLRTINIFYSKNTGLLFLSLYLCAQEIVPLVFLYEGLVYSFNIIEKNNTWQ